MIPSYGALAALGVILALLLAQRTAALAGLNANHLWNLCVVALFAALIGSRLFLVIVNWRVVLHHPSWILTLAMIHHPLVGAAGSLAAVAFAWLYARWQKMPVLAVADALAAPLALGLAFGQVGALLAGAGYGTEAGHGLPWAVTYTDPLATQWSGTPLYTPLHPVQGYAALCFLVLAVALYILLSRRRQIGDVAGVWLLGTGVAVFVTEIWRDRDGRGAVFGGLLDGPQIAAIVLVIAGGFLLRERKPGGQPEGSAAVQEPDASGDAKAEDDSAR